MIRTVLVLICFSLSAVGRAELTFNGVVVSTDSAAFALADDVSGEARWVRTGESFSGFGVGSYDAEKHTLLLKRDGEEVVLKLSQAKVRPLPAGLSANEEAAFQRLYRAAEAGSKTLADLLIRFQIASSELRKAQDRLASAKAVLKAHPDDPKSGADVFDAEEAIVGVNSAYLWLRSRIIAEGAELEVPKRELPKRTQQPTSSDAAGGAAHATNRR
jgi:nitrogen fixation protein